MGINFDSGLRNLGWMVYKFECTRECTNLLVYRKHEQQGETHKEINCRRQNCKFNRMIEFANIKNDIQVINDMLRLGDPLSVY